MILSDTEKNLGYIVSEKALAVLEFLESCAGAPEKAISLLFPGHYQKSLRILRGSGYARRCWTAGQDAMWIPAKFPVPDSIEEYRARGTLGWLAARLTQAGGEIKEGRAIFPGGQGFKLKISNDKIVFLNLNGDGSQFYVNYKNLERMDLRQCLFSVEK